MDAIASFGYWVQRRRKVLDLTRNDLARTVGCAAVTIKKIELDERRPSHQIAELLADALAVRAAERDLFVQVARGERAVDRLSSPLALEFAALPSSAETAVATPRMLPAPPTPLIGRQAEVAQLAWLLQDPTCRLLTLAGPGGIGKTRLAIEVATAERGRFADDVCFVPLADVSDETYVLAALAEALGFSFYGTDDAVDQLLRFLRGKELLLILDNFEHLMAAVGLVSRLVAESDRLKLLVTSREQLNLPGEWLFEVRGLPVPETLEAADEEPDSAVALFLHCARRARVGFTPTAEQRPAIVESCRLVEGMPLAIELAATWVRVLSPQEIAREIARTIDFLAAPNHHIPERHRSIRAVFEYSWHLLSESEQALLARLSIFRSGFTRRAAEQVAGASLADLATLVNKSLLRRDGDGLFSLHELIRQYARGYLAADAEGEAEVVERHVAYFTDWLEAAEWRLKSAEQHATLVEISSRLGDLRAAWQHALQAHQFDRLWRMLPCLNWYYEVQGYFREGIAEMGGAVEWLRERGAPDSLSGPGQIATFAFLLDCYGWFHFRTGDSERAVTLWQECRALAEPLDEPLVNYYLNANWAYLALVNGEWEAAETLAQQSLLHAERLDSTWARAISVALLGIRRLGQGEGEAAYETLHEGLALWRLVGEPRGLAFTLNYLSMVAPLVGRPEEARPALAESAALSAGTGDRWGQATALRLLGETYLQEGDLTEATARFEQAHDLSESIGDRVGMGMALTRLGQAAYAAGRVPAAQQAYEQALALAVDTQSLSVQTSALLGLALLKSEQADPQTAYEWVLLVQGHPATTPDTLQSAAALRSRLEASLPPDTVARAPQAAAAARLHDVVATLTGK